MVDWCLCSEGVDERVEKQRRFVEHLPPLRSGDNLQATPFLLEAAHLAQEDAVLGGEFTSSSPGNQRFDTMLNSEL